MSRTYVVEAYSSRVRRVDLWNVATTMIHFDKMWRCVVPAQSSRFVWLVLVRVEMCSYIRWSHIDRLHTRMHYFIRHMRSARTHRNWKQENDDRRLTHWPRSHQWEHSGHLTCREPHKVWPLVTLCEKIEKNIHRQSSIQFNVQPWHNNKLNAYGFESCSTYSIVSQ